MKILQDVWESQMKEHLSPHKLLARFIEKGLSKKGVTLTEDQMTEIVAQLLDPRNDGLTIEISEDQTYALGSKSTDEIREILRVDLRDSQAEIDQFLNQLSEALSEAMPGAMEDLSEIVLRQLKKDAAAMLRRRTRELKSFESRLGKTWRDALSVLKILLVICTELGDDFNEEYRAETSEQEDFVFEVLTRLHARACQIASEILVLLKSGFADGAHARWRSLHEIACVSYIIKSAGNDVAERYLLHRAIEAREAALEYQRHCQRLGYEPICESEMDKIEFAYQHLLDRFGTGYRQPYGWADPVFDEAKQKKRLGFRDIEAASGLEHHRPFYRMASHNVHANNPQGVFFKLGLYRNQEILLAGPSNMGLADPGQATAISLNQVTVNLLVSRQLNVDRVVALMILMKLVEEIEEKFVGTQKSLESQESA